MRQRYKWVVDERDPLTGMWSQVFDGSQPDMNRFLWARHFRMLDGAPILARSIRKRKVLKRVFVMNRVPGHPSRGVD